MAEASILQSPFVALFSVDGNHLVSTIQLVEYALREFFVITGHCAASISQRLPPLTLPLALVYQLLEKGECLFKPGRTSVPLRVGSLNLGCLDHIVDGEANAPLFARPISPLHVACTGTRFDRWGGPHRTSISAMAASACTRTSLYLIRRLNWPSAHLDCASVLACIRSRFARRTRALISRCVNRPCRFCFFTAAVLFIGLISQNRWSSPRLRPGLLFHILLKNYLDCRRRACRFAVPVPCRAAHSLQTSIPLARKYLSFGSSLFL